MPVRNDRHRGHHKRRTHAVRARPAQRTAIARASSTAPSASMRRRASSTTGRGIPAARRFAAAPDRGVSGTPARRSGTARRGPAAEQRVEHAPRPLEPDVGIRTAPDDHPVAGPDGGVVPAGRQSRVRQRDPGVADRVQPGAVVMIQTVDAPPDDHSRVGPDGAPSDPSPSAQDDAPSEKAGRHDIGYLDPL